MIPARIQSLVDEGERAAFMCRSFLNQDDVLMVFEEREDMMIATREDASLHGGSVAEALRLSPRGLTIVVCCKDGHVWPKRSMLALCNSEGGSC